MLCATLHLKLLGCPCLRPAWLFAANTGASKGLMRSGCVWVLLCACVSPAVS